MTFIQEAPGATGPDPRSPWLVSSPHKVLSREPGGAGYEPYGRKHARQVGCRWTACGEAAMGWKLFWEIPFAPDLELVCRKCVRALVEKEFGSAKAISS